MFHGDGGPVVPASQSFAFHQLLISLGVANQRTTCSTNLHNLHQDQAINASMLTNYRAWLHLRRPAVKCLRAKIATRQRCEPFLPRGDEPLETWEALRDDSLLWHQRLAARLRATRRTFGLGRGGEKGTVLVAWNAAFESSPMDQFFTELGRTVLARWKAQNFSLGRFPEIARDALEERPPAKHVNLASLIKEFLLDDEQPFQTQSGFGQPELVVHDDPRFYIQILFWLEGTTDIHQHKFSGAFHVLEGSSIHSHFAFENPEPISAHLRVGQLRMTDTRLLETGSTVPIVSGSGCIHSLFHLDTPSVSVVVRTHTDPGTGPQFTYLPPHLAVDPFHHDALTARRKQLLDVLEQMEDPTYPALVMEMIEGLDFERGFFILQN